MSSGTIAEQKAANYLATQGYKILDQNWRTRYCEIDIVASKASAVHFFEVKYRQQGRHGDGLDYITATKQRQMAFAAEAWVAEHEWQGDYYLGAIELSGDTFVVTALISDISA